MQSPGSERCNAALDIGEISPLCCIQLQLHWTTHCIAMQITIMQSKPRYYHLPHQRTDHWYINYICNFHLRQELCTDLTYLFTWPQSKNQFQIYYGFNAPWQHNTIHELLHCWTKLETFGQTWTQTNKHAWEKLDNHNYKQPFWHDRVHPCPQSHFQGWYISVPTQSQH